MKGKRKRDAESDQEESEDGDSTSDSSAYEAEEQIQKPAAAFRQKVLILSSRGVTQRMRHVMNDLSALLPQAKKGECLPCNPSEANSHFNTRCETRFQASALHGERTRRALILQQRSLLRSPSASRPIHVGFENAKWTKRSLPRLELAHHGRT